MNGYMRCPTTGGSSIASAALVDVVASGAVALNLEGMGSVCGGTCRGIFSN